MIVEDSRLPQHAVHERRFPMVDVGDNGDISDISLSHNISCPLPGVGPGFSVKNKKTLPVVGIADKTGGCPFNAEPPLIDLNTESKQ